MGAHAVGHDPAARRAADRANSRVRPPAISRTLVGATDDSVDRAADGVALRAIDTLRPVGFRDDLPAGRIRRAPARVRRDGGDGIIRRYADVPTRAVWKQESNLKGRRRSDALKNIDTAVDEYDAVRTDPDVGLRRRYLLRIDGFIRAWEQGKAATGGAGQSDRNAKIQELATVVRAKIQENLAEHAEELDPLAADYQQAVANRDWGEVEDIGLELFTEHNEFFATIATSAMQGADDGEWATVFCNAPVAAFGTAPFTVMALRARGDLSWLSKRQADRIVARLLLPSIAAGNLDPVVQMLQLGAFRNALLAKASPAYVAKLMEMPLVRIAATAEADVATKIAPPSIKDIADSAFAAFLGDQPVSGLGYATNSADFKASEFLLSDSAQAKRAPCMVLSNMMTTIFKSVLPSGDMAATPLPVQDMVPLLTKPLASIGNRGILTRDTAFYGNVERFGDVRGYQAVNRIFFGDGHEWLQVGNTEYDPTLGISGPVGTVRAQVEHVTYTKKGDKFKGDDGTVVKRNKKVPPGGARLLFQRSVTIE